MTLRYTNRADERVGERKHDVSRGDLPHVLVKGISPPALAAFRRPQESAAGFLAKRLILVYPPKAHVRNIAGYTARVQAGER